MWGIVERTKALNKFFIAYYSGLPKCEGCRDLEEEDQPLILGL